MLRNVKLLLHLEVPLPLQFQGGWVDVRQVCHKNNNQIFITSLSSSSAQYSPLLDIGLSCSPSRSIFDNSHPAPASRPPQTVTPPGLWASYTALTETRSPLQNSSMSLPQHDEKHVVPTPLSGIRVGQKKDYTNVIR
jgi:hypothetical protein